MKITLIGGSGFLGSNISKLFYNKSLSFQIFDIHKSQFFPEKGMLGDIRNFNELSKIGETDVLINLAAVHRDDVSPISLYDEVNVLGSKNICKYAEEKSINKIIFSSSVAIYGFAEPNTKEDGPINYFNDYGRTKYLAELEYIKWFEKDPDNRCLTIVRPTVIFGKGNRGNVYSLLSQINSKKFAMFGNGLNIKSMAYVKNVAAFFEYSLNFDKGIHKYNYIDKPDMNMNKLIKKVRKALFKKNTVGVKLPAFMGLLIGKIADFISLIINKNLPISSIRIKKFLSTTQFDSSISETGFVAPYSIEMGLNETIKYEFLENHKNRITFETE